VEAGPVPLDGAEGPFEEPPVPLEEVPVPPVPLTGAGPELPPEGRLGCGLLGAGLVGTTARVPEGEPVLALPPPLATNVGALR